MKLTLKRDHFHDNGEHVQRNSIAVSIDNARKKDM